MPGYKPQITYGQGLLLLMQVYQDDPKKLEELKVLYLCGASTPENRTALLSSMKEPSLERFELVTDENSINRDPTRRYFETLLAYETLKHQLNDISSSALETHYDKTSALVSPRISATKLQDIQDTIAGEFKNTKFKTNQNVEFSNYIKRINEKTIFDKLSDDDREKITWLVKIAYKGLVNGWRQTKMPIDIYMTHPWFLNRGKISYPETQSESRSQHFGLLKSYMPLPRHDKVVSMVPYTHVKPSEYSTFDSESEVIQNCFQQLVHPFSNSISGVLLTQLRVLARLQQDDSHYELTKSLANFIQFMRLFISSSLYYSGGHSLYEYAFILSMPEIQEAFQTTPGFNTINLEVLFYQGNEEAFDASLDATIEYNTQILARKKVHQQLHGFFAAQQYRPSPVSVTASCLNMFSPI